ncbi:hypothetical protein GC176_23775 [bacterium]|nr:hypothetical protein [bacterium]
MSDSLKDVPLRDVCKEAERLTLEVIDHLNRNLIPRTRELHELVKPDSPFDETGAGVKDITVRNHVATLLESQRFAEEFFLKTRDYLESVDSHLSEITGH